VLPVLSKTFTFEDPPQIHLLLIQNFHLFLEKSTATEHKNYFLPFLIKSLDSIQPEVQIEALKKAEDCVNSKLIGYMLFKNSILPKIESITKKTTLTAVRVNAVICLGRVSSILDKDTLALNVVPILEHCISVDQSSTTLMSVVGVFHRISKQFDANFIAVRILPILIPISIQKSLTLEQFQKYIKSVKTLLDVVEEARMSELLENKELEKVDKVDTDIKDVLAPAPIPVKKVQVVKEVLDPWDDTFVPEKKESVDPWEETKTVKPQVKPIKLESMESKAESKESLDPWENSKPVVKQTPPLVLKPTQKPIPSVMSDPWENTSKPIVKPQQPTPVVKPSVITPDPWDTHTVESPVETWNTQKKTYGMMNLDDLLETKMEPVIPMVIPKPKETTPKIDPFFHPPPTVQLTPKMDPFMAPTRAPATLMQFDDDEEDWGKSLQPTPFTNTTNGGSDDQFDRMMAKFN
jgi:hypothetical protein